MIPNVPGSLIENLRPLYSGKKILLGVTGSIAAFKACDLIRIFRECGAEVKVVLTASAQKFVTATTLETLSGYPVFTSLWDEDGHGTHHIDAARWADLIFVAPATAHVIAKLANGFADDLLSTEILAFKGPVLIAPAMNPVMYAHPATQANIRTLESRGVRILGPCSGITACKEEGLGRMLEPLDLVIEAGQSFYAPSREKTILITTGGTRSFIDPVRYITNRSSGVMGAALAWASVSRGYSVTVVSGPTDVVFPRNAKVISVNTARQMHEAVMENWPKTQVYIGTAAVLDWDVKNISTTKLKKENGPLTLEFEENPDILASVSKTKTQNQYVLGFAAETQNFVQNALKKRKSKGCDAIFVNDVSSTETGFESLENAGWWVSDEIYELKRQSKARLAHQMIDLIEGKQPEWPQALEKTAPQESSVKPSRKEIDELLS